MFFFLSPILSMVFIDGRDGNPMGFTLLSTETVFFVLGMNDGWDISSLIPESSPVW